MKPKIKNSTFHSKRGNVIVDSFYFLIILVVLAIVAVVATFLNNTIHDALIDNQMLTGEAKVILEKNTDIAPQLFDYMVGTVFGLLWLLGIIASFYMRSHPIFFMATLLIILAEVVVGAYLSSGISDVFTEGLLASSYSAMPITHHLISNFVIYVIVMAITIGWVLYAKRG